MTGIQDVGTIAAWTPARLTRYIQNELNQRSQTIKGTVSADQLFAHESLVFSSGDFQTADTTLARPNTGILTINNNTIATQPWVQSQGYLTSVTYPVTSVFGRTGAVVATNGDYTADQVTNAADKASASTQAFTGAITTTQLTATSNSGVVSQAASGSHAFRNFLLAGDTNPSFEITGAGVLEWGPGGASALDTSLSRGGTNLLVTGGDHFSTGPLNNARSTTGIYLEATTGRVLATAASDPTTSMFATAFVGDAQWRWTIDSNGAMTWGTGAGIGDTGLSRSAAVPPSSGQVGLFTQQSFYSTNTTGGFVYAAPSNNSAFLSFLLASDANPAFKIFTQGAFEWGPGGASAMDLELARVTNSTGGTGTFLELLIGSGFGYGTGTGGAVTQATSLSTGVTINKPSGVITLFTSAIAAGLYSSFTVTNSVVGINDTIVVSGEGCTGLVICVTSVAAGAFQISHYAPASVASSTKKINFTVIKGSAA